MNDIFRKTLIISPHFDDETIGCGGLISRINHDIHSEIKIVVVATSNSYSYAVQRLVGNNEREEECMNALEVLGIIYPEAALIHLDGYDDGNLDQCDMKKLITSLDDIIRDYEPTAVLFPYSSHHQDHQIVHRASISALRPTVDTNFIKLKAMYEYPYINSWSSNINPNNKMYITLSEADVNRKINALRMYKSQLIRDPRDILSVEAIMNQAKSRGIEICQNYAEAYYPMSMIID